MKCIVTAVYRYTPFSTINQIVPWSMCVLEQAVGFSYSYSIKAHHLVG